MWAIWSLRRHKYPSTCYKIIVTPSFDFRGLPLSNLKSKTSDQKLMSLRSKIWSRHGCNFFLPLWRFFFLFWESICFSNMYILMNNMLKMNFTWQPRGNPVATLDVFHLWGTSLGIHLGWLYLERQLRRDAWPFQWRGIEEWNEWDYIQNLQKSSG